MSNEMSPTWKDRLISWAWILLMAGFSSFITIKVTISEVQAQITQTKDMLTEMRKADQQMFERIHALEVEDASSKEQRREITARLEKIDHNQERMMEMLSRMLLASKGIKN